MRRTLLRRPSPAMIVACLALALALAGTSYAAVQMLPRGSVGTLQLRNGSVTTAKLRQGAVTTSRLHSSSVTTRQVRNGTLLRADFRPGQLGSGDGTGVQGPPGPAGPAGPPGIGGLQRVDVSTSSSSANSKSLLVNCPSSKKVVGGGARVLGSGSRKVAIVASFPDSSGTQWDATASEVDLTAQSWQLQAYALCATVAS